MSKKQIKPHDHITALWYLVCLIKHIRHTIWNNPLLCQNRKSKNNLYLEKVTGGMLILVNHFFINSFPAFEMQQTLKLPLLNFNLYFRYQHSMSLTISKYQATKLRSLNSYMLCILTSSWVLHVHGSWSKHFFLVVFNFLVHLNLFQWFHAWNQEKRLKMNEISWPALKSSLKHSFFKCF